MRNSIYSDDTAVSAADVEKKKYETETFEDKILKVRLGIDGKRSKGGRGEALKKRLLDDFV